jgi:hypothetical protein
MKMRAGSRSLIVNLVALAAPAVPALADWTVPARLNDAVDIPRRVQYPRIAPAADGGFHVVYQAWDDQNASGRAEYLRYRRFSPTGTLGSQLTLPEVVSTNGVNKPEVAVAGNGDVHVVWESWNGGPRIAWTRSTDSGSTYASPSEISSVAIGGRANESPQIAGLGTGSSNQAVITWRNTTDDSLEFLKFNGTSWTGYGWTGSYTSGLSAAGIALNPVTGNVHKMTDNGSNAGWRTYNGTSWSSAADAYTGVTQAVEPSMAINQSGQTMFLIDNSFVSKAQLVNADGSLGTFNGDLFSGRRNFGTVTAIPGTNDFFAVDTDATQSASNQSTHIFARRYHNGTWEPMQTIATIPETPEMIYNMDVAADKFGSLLVTWQYNIVNPNPVGEQTPWRPNVYYTMNIVPEPATLALAALGVLALFHRPRTRARAN